MLSLTMELCCQFSESYLLSYNESSWFVDPHSSPLTKTHWNATSSHYWKTWLTRKDSQGKLHCSEFSVQLISQISGSFCYTRLVHCPLPQFPSILQFLPPYPTLPDPNCSCVFTQTLAETTRCVCREKSGGAARITPGTLPLPRYFCETPKKGSRCDSDYFADSWDPYSF